MSPSRSDDEHRPLAPEAALEALLRGNDRFRAGQALHPRQTVARRQAAATGQQPFAAVLTCADSRVPPELLFDQGLGDLYVVRVAGNAVTELVTGSLEFAVEALGVSVILVLGHELCAAVAAAVAALRPEVALPVRLPGAWQAGWLGQGAAAPGALEAVLASVRLGLAGPWATYDAAVKANVGYGVEALRRSPLIAARVREGTLSVVGAHYALESGRVTVIPTD